MKDLIIVGAGGFCKEVIWLAEETNQFIVKGILDDKLTPGELVNDIPVIGNLETAATLSNSSFVIAIGSPRVRSKVYDKLITLGITDFPNLIHPTVIKSKLVTLGKGNLICAGTVLTTNIAIGDFSIINLNCSIGHDCEIADFVTIAPLCAISGNVKLHDQVEVGTGASIRQGVIIKKGGMLGMGGVLTKEIEKNQIFVGNPAKLFKSF